MQCPEQNQHVELDYLQANFNQRQQYAANGLYIIVHKKCAVIRAITGNRKHYIFTIRDLTLIRFSYSHELLFGNNIQYSLAFYYI